jgi:peptide/nickel transport system substrate-binding protein
MQKAKVWRRSPFAFCLLHFAFCLAAKILPFAFCLTESAQAQRAGGSVTVAASAEPKTLNPLVAADQPSRDAIYPLSADLVHLNRATLVSESALAKSWRVSRDGKQYLVTLRPGLRFSDGSPLTADDVVFTFQVHLDPKVNSTQRDVLLIDDKPIGVVKVSADTVRFDLPAPYAPGEQLFDGVWILPRAKLEKAYREGHINEVWNTAVPPVEIAGAGPFRLKQYLPGQRLVLERNPFYWKKDEAGRTLPYLDRLEFSFASDANAQLLRLRAGEVDILPRVRADDFAALAGRPELRAQDAGPALEYNFLAFNWGTAGPARAWFRNPQFRRAVAHAVDRDSIVKLVYQGKASPIWSQVTPGNRVWHSDKAVQYQHDPARASALLQQAGFKRDSSGTLRDPDGRAVEFTLMVSASNAARRKMATLVEEDLGKIGIRAHATPTEFAAMVDAVLHAGRYEAVLWGIAGGDPDPGSDANVWMASGNLHMWNLRLKDQPAPALEPWEAEIDHLMQTQMTLIAAKARKAAIDRVQDLVSANLPVVFLVSPHVLSASRAGVGGFAPAVVEPVALWNCERLYRAQ